MARVTSGDQIAGDALRWKGESYIYGGTGARPGDWDCSSFVSWVLGRDLGIGLPGGSWASVTGRGTLHGPVVESYASWRGAMTVQAPGRRGDLVCFVGEGTSGHIGIVLGPDQMVSALDSASGTLVTPITGYGPPGAPIVYRRVLAAAAGSGLSGIGAKLGGQPQLTGAQQGAGLLAIVAMVGVMAGAVLLLAVLAGVAVPVAGSLLVRKAVSDA